MNNKIRATFLCLLVGIVFGQKEIKYGIGFNVEINGLSSLIQLFESGQNSSINGIYFPIEKDGYLIEPSISYMTSSVIKDFNNNDYDEKSSTSNITAMLGVFKLFERDKVRFNVGLRAGKTWINEKYNYSDEDEEVDEQDLLIISPTIGAEYFISNHFSFAGEAIFTMTNLKDSGEVNSFYSSEDLTYSETRKVNSLTHKFILRYYF
ncbi:MAG: hypothetical protein H8E60_08575 [Candidatus Marinimicrobia bacterium]|nr:hypothetical protein [Candidatus Neomarinimicrobiota bacterium]